MENDKYSYIATLGFAPQVVTLGLQAVQKQFPYHKIDRVIVLHTSPSIHENRRSLEILSDAFEQNEFLKKYKLEFREITLNGKPIRDILTSKDVEATLRCLIHAIADAKSSGQNVHFNVSGGRKSMSILGVVAAQLLFDENDYAWHLVSEPGFMDRQELLTDDLEQITLVELPIMPWSMLKSTYLLIPGLENTPQSLSQFLRSTYRYKRRAALVQFINQKLTPSERMILREIVLNGGSNKEIAERLGKSPRTVEHQLQSIYRKFKEEFGVSRDKLSRDILVREFSEVMAADK